MWKLISDDFFHVDENHLLSLAFGYKRNNPSQESDSAAAVRLSSTDQSNEFDVSVISADETKLLFNYLDNEDLYFGGIPRKMVPDWIAENAESIEGDRDTGHVHSLGACFSFININDRNRNAQMYKALDGAGIYRQAHKSIRWVFKRQRICELPINF